MKVKQYQVWYGTVSGRTVEQFIREEVVDGKPQEPDFVKIFKDVMKNGLLIEEKREDGTLKRLEYHQVVSAAVKTGRETLVDVG